MNRCLVATSRPFHSFWFGLFSLVFIVSLAWSQGVTGVISGTVTDPTKAPIVNAAVTITNADTGVVAWTGHANVSGVFRAPNLPVGRYDVVASAPGFKKQQISGLHLDVDQRADVSIALEVGQVSETITVEGSQAAELATDTSSLGNTITPEFAAAKPERFESSRPHSWRVVRW